MESDPTIEFSRIVMLDQIGPNGLTFHVEAKPEECLLLAERFQLIAIHQLFADFTLSLGEEKGWFRVEGKIIGDVVQSCVSTLRDVPARVQTSIHMLLKPSREEEQEHELLIDLEDEVDIEYYTQESVDLGEVAAQYMSLNLDPFPHAPGAPDFPEPPEEKPTNPFAQALKGLKKK